MKTALLIPLMLVCGVGVGGASGWAVVQLKPPTSVAGKAAQEPSVDADLVFVPAGALLVPVTVEDGTLTGYVTIECSVQVDAADAEEVKARIPLLLHAINMQTFRVPLAVGPGQQLPNLQRYRTIVQAAAISVFGAGTIRRIAITKAQPV